jgi:recombinational DNA repair ATPase RecF
MEISQRVEEQSPPEQASLSVSNIGGIDETHVSFEQGITVLSGRNATNRTSLLQGIMATLGSDQASLKADSKEGQAALEFGEETYQRTLHRRNGTVVTEGDPYLDDPEVADLSPSCSSQTKLARLFPAAMIYVI